MIRDVNLAILNACQNPIALIEKNEKYFISIANKIFLELFNLEENNTPIELETSIPYINWKDLFLNSPKEVFIENTNKKLKIDMKIINHSLFTLTVEELSSEVRQIHFEENREWKYQSIIDNLNDIYMRVDIYGTILMVSPSILKKLNYPDIFEIIGEDISNILNIDISYIKEKENEDFDIHLHRNSDYFGRANFAKVYNAENQVVAYEGIINDITELRKHMMQTEKEKDNFYNFFNSIKDCIIVSDLSGNIITCNDFTQSHLGYKIEELKDMKYSSLYEDKGKNYIKGLIKNISNIKNEIVNLPLLKKNNDRIYVETDIWKGIWNGKDCIFSLSKDLTKINEVNDRFKAVYKNNSALMAIVDINSKMITSINNSFYESLDYSKFDILGQNLNTTNLIYNTHDFVEIFNHIIKFKKIDKQEIILKKKNGEKFIGLLSGEILKTTKENEILFVIIDITKQYELMKKLEEEKNIFSDGPVMSVIWGSEDTWPIKYVSNNVTRILGYSPHDWYDEDFIHSTLIHPDDFTRIKNEVKYNIENRIDTYEQEYRIKNKNGSYIYVYDFTKLIRDDRGILMEIREYIFDQTERKTAKQKINNLSKQLELAYDSANLGLWEYYSENNTIYLDNRLKEMINLKSDKNLFSFEEWIKLVLPEDVNNTFKAFKNSLNNDNDFSLEFRTLTPFIKYWKSTGKIVKDEDGFKKIIGFNLDITDIKNAEDKANRANKAKSEFLSNMSHEIRTPLNGIIGFADFLSEQSLPKEISEAINIIKISGQNLLNIINDILDISKIESGHMNLNKEIFDINNLVFEVSSTFRKNIEGKNIQYILEYNNTIPHLLIGDSTKIKQILHNLISNSIKFTSNGYIKLKLDIFQKKENRIFLSFEVEDTGCGINEKKQKSLFEKFEQGEHFLTKKHGGTGLGLALVKQLMDLLEGYIEVNTVIDKGTKFKLIIPFELAVTEKETLSFNENFADSGQGKILIAEDQEINQKLLKLIFKETSYNITIVPDGKSLLNIFEKKDFDLILMDIQMPIINGLEATKLIRDKSKIPIIGLSAFALVEETEKAIACGMNDFVTKPIVKEILLKKIENWLKLKNETSI